MFIGNISHLPDDLHAHADGRVAVAADEAQVRLAHQALDGNEYDFHHTQCEMYECMDEYYERRNKSETITCLQCGVESLPPLLDADPLPLLAQLGCNSIDISDYKYKLKTTSIPRNYKFQHV